MPVSEDGEECDDGEVDLGETLMLRGSKRLLVGWKG